MRFTTIHKAALLILALLIITGCERVTYYQIIPVSGYLETPDGKYEFRTVSKSEAIEFNLNRAERISYAYLTAEGNDIKVFFSLSTIQALRIFSTEKNAKVTVTANSAHIQIDSNDPQPAKQPNQTRKHILGKRLYKNSEATNFWYGDVGLLRPQGNLNTKDHSKRYNYHIPFKINDTPYLIDLTFTFEKKKEFRWKIGVPATP